MINIVGEMKKVRLRPMTDNELSAYRAQVYPEVVPVEPRPQLIDAVAEDVLGAEVVQKDAK